MSVNLPHKLPYIVKQELALDVYLGTLLEGLDRDDAESSTVAPASAKPVVLQPAPVIAPSVVTPALAPLVVTPSVEVQTPAVAAEPGITRQQMLSVMPEWSRGECKVLLFRVGLLTLATPLAYLLRARKFDCKLTKIPGQPSWFLGLVEDHNQRIGVLDTAQLLLGRARGGQRDLQHEPYRHILVTSDQRWGLTCDDILSVNKLTPEEVRWRTDRQKRPWLVGTLIDQLVAVIDVEILTPRRTNKKSISA